MLQCWKTAPHLRPSFTELVESLSSQLASIAEYIPVVDADEGKSGALHAESSV